MANLNLSDLRKVSKKFLKKPEPRGCGLLTEAPNVYPDAADRLTAGSGSQSSTTERVNRGRSFQAGVSGAHKRKAAGNFGFLMRYEDRC